MRAGLRCAVGIEAERVVGNGKTLGGGHGVLTLLDLGVVKLFHFAAVQAHQMVVVLACIEFKNSPPMRGADPSSAVFSA